MFFGYGVPELSCGAPLTSAFLLLVPPTAVTSTLTLTSLMSTSFGSNRTLCWVLFAVLVALPPAPAVLLVLCTFGRAPCSAYVRDDWFRRECNAVPPAEWVDNSTIKLHLK